MADQMFGRVLAGEIRTRFQPVFDVSVPGEPAVVFHEALSAGPADSRLASADVLFAHARRCRRESELDVLCIETALRRFHAAGDGCLSVNVHSSTVTTDPQFASFVLSALDRHGIAPGCLVVEIVEHVRHFEAGMLQQRLDPLRSRGIGLALDDVGEGQSNFRLILDCRPDYLKIDRSIVSGCGTDAVRRAILESLVLLANRIGAQPVAEGIETTMDLWGARQAGVRLMQGFLLGVPGPDARVARSAATVATGDYLTFPD